MTLLKFTPTFKGTYLETLLSNLIEENKELQQEVNKLYKNQIKTNANQKEIDANKFKITENKGYISTLRKVIAFQENEMNREYNNRTKHFDYNDTQKDEIRRSINHTESEIKDPDFIQDLNNTGLFTRNDNPGAYVPEMVPVIQNVVIPEPPNLEQIMNQNVNFTIKKESPKPNYTENFKQVIENKTGNNSFSPVNINNQMNHFGNNVIPTNANVATNSNAIITKLVQEQVQNIVKQVPKVQTYLSDFILHEPLDTKKLTDLQENWVFKILKGDSKDKIKKIIEIDMVGQNTALEYNKKAGIQKQMYNPIFTEDFAVYLVRERPNLIADIISVIPNWNLSERIIYNAVRSNINFNKKSGKLLKSPLIFLHMYEPKFLMPFVLLTVKSNGNSIENFPLYQTEKVQLTAIENDPKSIKYITEPTPAVIKKVLDSDCLLVKYIPKKLITFEIKNFCIKTNGLSIVYFDNITEKQRVLAITSNLDSIKFLRHKQTVGFQFVFLNLVPKNRFSLIKNIIAPTLEVQARIIQLSIYNIQYIENPHWKIIVNVINADPNYKKYGLYWTTWLKSKIYSNSIKIDPEGNINAYINQIIKEDFNRSVNRFKNLLDSKKIVYSANSRSKMVKNDKDGNNKGLENNKDNKRPKDNKGPRNNKGNGNNKGPGNTKKKTSSSNILIGYQNLLDSKKKSSSSKKTLVVPDWFKGKPEDYDPNYKKSNVKKYIKKNNQEQTPKKDSNSDGLYNEFRRPLKKSSSNIQEQTPLKRSSSSKKTVSLQEIMDQGFEQRSDEEGVEF